MPISPEELLADALEARNADAATAIRDGRRMRAERGRAAVLNAAYELVNAGGTPTVADIAERAGVSERTVFRYFPDREALMAGLAGELVQIVGPYVVAEPPPGDLDHRVRDLLRLRLDLERISGAFTAAVDRISRDSQLAHDLRTLRRDRLREQVRSFLTPECEGANAVVLPAIYGMLEHATMASMLEDATEAEVLETLRCTILRLLAP